MPHLNEGIMPESFNDENIIRAEDRTGFKGAPKVVTIDGPFKLYKLTSDGAPEHLQRKKVTPWWSAVEPYLEDTEGALGRFKQAYLNGIDMSSMVRYMSAVKVEWNKLEKYVEISIKPGDKVSCFWGEFATIPHNNQPNDVIYQTVRQTISTGLGYQEAALPDTLGVLSAWQFYIPNFSDAYIAQGAAGRKQVNAHNMAALGAHFHFPLGHVSLLGKATEFFKPFYVETNIGMFMQRNPILKEMDDCVKMLREFTISPRETIRRFCERGRAYEQSRSSDPQLVKAKVKDFVDRAESLLR